MTAASYFLISHSFLESAKVVGRSTMATLQDSYGQYVGTVLGLIDDPYNPKIKVAFPEHEHPAMREVSLIVDKKKRSGILT